MTTTCKHAEQVRWYPDARVLFCEHCGAISVFTRLGWMRVVKVMGEHRLGAPVYYERLPDETPEGFRARIKALPKEFT